MGEIADAIRRARRQPAASEGDAERSGLEAVPGPAARSGSAGELHLARPDSPVETIEPENEAIILEDGPNAELCRRLVLRLRSELEARGARSVAVVSAERGDGKTTVVCDLGIALASLSQGREVALVDLDLRNPSLARYLSLTPQMGLEELLLGRGTLDDVRVGVQQPAIDVYATLVPQRAAHERIVLPRFAEVIAELERRYATVIVDTPPALLVPDASLVLRHVDVFACVVRAGKTRARSIRQLVEVLPQAQFVGGILNCDSSPHARYTSYEYYYGPEGEGDPPRRGKRSRKS